MSRAKQAETTTGQSRREFLKKTGAVAGAAAVGSLSVARGAHAAGKGGFKFGLIGCGGRGSGAAVNAMNAGEDIKLVAMADIFEALTATDRPYMPPKTLSRAVGIMRSMCDSGHLCPDLFALFLRSGVYRRYAEQFLQPQQLDDVDVGGLIGAERPMAS